jgi:hypothetical protein
MPPRAHPMMRHRRSVLLAPRAVKSSRPGYRAASTAARHLRASAILQSVHLAVQMNALLIRKRILVSVEPLAHLVDGCDVIGRRVDRAEKTGTPTGKMCTSPVPMKFVAPTFPL